MYKVVVPGDFISKDVKRAGAGTYVEDGKVYAMYHGIVSDKEELRVVPLSGKYVPTKGDIVIGKIVDISFPFWIVDIASPYEARLHASEFGERRGVEIDLGNMNKYLDLGDLIVGKVMNVDALMRVDLSLKDEFKIGDRGRLIEIPHTKVPRVIGRNGSMIKMLKEKSNCFIFIAKNGRIWIEGREAEMNLVSEVVLMISNEAHTSGLTDRVAQFLDSFKKNKRMENKDERRRDRTYKRWKENRWTGF
ncbi:MAG: exosome complex RNA-binding protein Rrp4 [Candidatus Methanospirareceae archaeon]